MTERAFHLIGIGGAGMSVVAELLAARGMRVSGSDQADSAVLDHLRSLGIDARVGHDAAHVPADAIVVVSTAVRESNPELACARARSQAVIHRSQALALAASGMRFVAVAGAHGKTTTSGMIASALRAAGADPSIAVGSILPELGSGAHLGTDDIFVAEADESDASFLNYRPTIEVITNVEPDHLDRYESREAFEQVFADFVDCLEDGGVVVCCAEDEGAARLAAYARESGRRVVTYGRAEHSYAGMPDVVIEDAHSSARGARARVRRGEVSCDLVLSVPGMHNVFNGVAAWIAGCELGIAPEPMAQALRHFSGTARRFEFRGETRGRRVFDDYAHHPTEVEAALAQARDVADGGEVTVVFQPHLYSRTLAFAERFARALSHADHVVVCDIYGAREDPVEGVDSTVVTRHLRSAHYVPDMHEATRLAAELTPEGGVLITMGAGSVTQCAEDALTTWAEMA